MNDLAKRILQAIKTGSKKTELIVILNPHSLTEGRNGKIQKRHWSAMVEVLKRQTNAFYTIYTFSDNGETVIKNFKINKRAIEEIMTAYQEFIKAGIMPEDRESIIEAFDLILPDKSEAIWRMVN